MDELNATDNPSATLTEALWFRDPDIRRARFATDVWANCVWHSERILVPKTRIELRRVPVYETRTDAKEPRIIGHRRTIELVPVETGEASELAGDHRVLTRDAITGRRSPMGILKPTSAQPLRAQGDLHPVFEVKLLVDTVIGGDHRLIGLLLTLYPRFGPYATDQKKLSAFRPAWLVHELEGYDGANPGRVMDDCLRRMHKEFLRQLAEAVTGLKMEFK